MTDATHLDAAIQELKAFNQMQDAEGQAAVSDFWEAAKLTGKFTTHGVTRTVSKNQHTISYTWFKQIKIEDKATGKSKVILASVKRGVGPRQIKIVMGSMAPWMEALFNQTEDRLSVVRENMKEAKKIIQSIERMKKKLKA